MVKKATKEVFISESEEIFDSEEAALHDEQIWKLNKLLLQFPVYWRGGVDISEVAEYLAKDAKQIQEILFPHATLKPFRGMIGQATNRGDYISGICLAKLNDNRSNGIAVGEHLTLSKMVGQTPLSSGVSLIETENSFYLVASGKPAEVVYLVILRNVLGSDTFYYTRARTAQEAWEKFVENEHDDGFSREDVQIFRCEQE